MLCDFDVLQSRWSHCRVCKHTDAPMGETGGEVGVVGCGPTAGRCHLLCDFGVRKCGFRRASVRHPPPSAPHPPPFRFWCIYSGEALVLYNILSHNIILEYYNLMRTHCIRLQYYNIQHLQHPTSTSADAISSQDGFCEPPQPSGFRHVLEATFAHT